MFLNSYITNKKCLVTFHLVGSEVPATYYLPNKVVELHETGVVLIT